MVASATMVGSGWLAMLSAWALGATGPLNGSALSCAVAGKAVIAAEVRIGRSGRVAIIRAKAASASANSASSSAVRTGSGASITGNAATVARTRSAIEVRFGIVAGQSAIIAGCHAIEAAAIASVWSCAVWAGSVLSGASGTSCRCGCTGTRSDCPSTKGASGLGPLVSGGISRTGRPGSCRPFSSCAIRRRIEASTSLTTPSEAPGSGRIMSGCMIHLGEWGAVSPCRWRAARGQGFRLVCW